MTDAFHGAKAAVFIGEDMLVYQRDRGVRWPGYWDFPGGGREGGETPQDCLRREVLEEFGLAVSDSEITWGKAVAAMADPTETAWFFVVQLPNDAKDRIRFGNEGQQWALMPLNDVAILPNLVPALRDRLTLWLQDTGRDLI